MQALAAGGGGVEVIQSFFVSGTWTAPTGVTSVDYLVVAGGASGASASGAQGGGGGAGGFRTGTALAVTAGTTYTITVGAGGASSSLGSGGNNGSNSVFSSITSAGGGAGCPPWCRLAAGWWAGGVDRGW